MGRNNSVRGASDEKLRRKPSRRNFLIGLGAGGASATVALVSKQRKPDTGGSEKSETNKGYRVTEHVRNYYRTAKV